MLLKPCPFCEKDIPRAITVCPYCHRNEKGQSEQMDTAAAPAANGKYFEDDLADLASEDPYIREQAVVRTAQHGFNVVQALISILSDQAKPGLAAIAKVLGRVGDRRAIGVLTQAVKQGDDELRTAAIWALAQFREPEVLPVLLNEAERPSPTIQGYIAHVLGSFQDARVIPVLSNLGKHGNREVSFQAAYALGETGDAQAIAPLRTIFRRRDPVVQAAAAAALRRLGASAGTPKKFILWIVLGFVAVFVAGAWWLMR